MDKQQFFDLGCPSCTELKMQENMGRVVACTTQDFDGFIANIRPGSFATRFIGLEKSIPGFYALVVRGEIPPEIADEEDEGIDLGENVGLEKETAGGVDFLNVDFSDAESDVGVSAPVTTMTAASTQSTAASPAKPKAAKEKKPPKPKPESKKRKPASSEAGKPAPPSRDSDVSSMSEANDFIGKFVDFANDSDASDSEAASSKAGSAKKQKIEKESSHGGTSHGTGTSRGSVAILAPEEDTEFRGAPE